MELEILRSRDHNLNHLHDNWATQSSEEGHEMFESLGNDEQIFYLWLMKKM